VENPARIWWCPTGPLAFLPLHAAGIYAQSTPFTSGSCLADFAISSYTPTVSSLLGKIRRPADELELSSSKLLIVSQPKTKGLPPNLGTTIEMNAISTTLGSNDCESLCLEGEAATISRVQLEMESHSSIHSACHAKQDIDDPLKSGFYLHDGRLELADIIRQIFLIASWPFYRLVRRARAMRDFRKRLLFTWPLECSLWGIKVWWRLRLCGRSQTSTALRLRNVSTNISWTAGRLLERLELTASTRHALSVRLSRASESGSVTLSKAS